MGIDFVQVSLYDLANDIKHTTQQSLESPLTGEPITIEQAVELATEGAIKQWSKHGE